MNTETSADFSHQSYGKSHYRSFAVISVSRLVFYNSAIPTIKRMSASVFYFPENPYFHKKINLVASLVNAPTK